MSTSGGAMTLLSLSPEIVAVDILFNDATSTRIGPPVTSSRSERECKNRRRGSGFPLGFYRLPIGVYPYVRT
jgi:hypothetical protein